MWVGNSRDVTLTLNRCPVVMVRLSPTQKCHCPWAIGCFCVHAQGERSLRSQIGGRKAHLRGSSEGWPDPTDSNSVISDAMSSWPAFTKRQPPGSGLMVVTLMSTTEDMGGETCLCWAWHREQLEVMGTELKFPMSSL